MCDQVAEVADAVPVPGRRHRVRLDDRVLPAEADAGDLRNPADPLGWHELPESDGPGFRRARRIDVSQDPGSSVIRIDAAFQDSAKRRDGSRVAIHEYDLAMTADADTLEILSLAPQPRLHAAQPVAPHSTGIVP